MSSTEAKAGKPTTRLWSCRPQGQRSHTYLAPISAFELGNPDLSPSDVATRSDGVSESGIAGFQVTGDMRFDIPVSYNPSRPAAGHALAGASQEIWDGSLTN